MPGSALNALATDSSVRWISLDGAVRQTSTATASFTTWATDIGISMPSTFTDLTPLIDSAIGPNGTFGLASTGQVAVRGFNVEMTPGTKIMKVEAVLHGYTATALGDGEDPMITVAISDTVSAQARLDHRLLNTHVGIARAGALYVDLTALRNWQWSDVDDLELRIDQRWIAAGHTLYYDAIGLRITAGPGLDSIDLKSLPLLPAEPLDSATLANVYTRVVGAPEIWNRAPKYLQGQGITVAVVDSGIQKNKDIKKHFLGSVNFNAAYHDSNDRYGHGSFVAGILAGDGSASDGERIGIAPKANLINLRVSDDQGMSTESDVVDALQWIFDNHRRYNIRVVNLSLNAASAQSYHTSPLCAAVEILWFNGITVVVSAGNAGRAALYPPANDPFAITVGAADDRGTLKLSDDSVAAFSSYGTIDGIAKPDLVAPGANIIGYLPDNEKLTVGQEHPSHMVNKDYFRMSGTSMAAPIVSGAVALLLQDEPTLTPDQVKYRLMATAVRSRTIWPGYSAQHAGSGYLNIRAAIDFSSSQRANAGRQPSDLLMTGSAPLTADNWSSANWSSANWSSANWSSASWGGDTWDTLAYRAYVPLVIRLSSP
jgi:serine protease AprX